MSQCKKFAPNIFHKTKCSNCFRQKEEHSAEALECNRASRSIARSGYLFVAPDWDFSVPLNRTKRWQRRWFVLYDDGELNYSVDEHPDTIPQGSVDMSKVLEVTGAEQVTGHPHSLALTSPDRVTFVKAASREDARWWAELLAVFPRRHKRNATFPGGRASPSLPQLGRSASPQPPRPRHLSCSGPSPRTNFETPPLKEERESPPKEEPTRPGWLPEPTGTVPIEPPPGAARNDYLMSSGSPPTRDKLRCEDKARTRRDWRNERFRDIATALTDRSPESSLALPAESLLHLKKGWLWLKNADGDFVMRWAVLCGPSLTIYRDQDEQSVPEIVVEKSTVTGYNEIPTETKFGFEVKWAGSTLVLYAVTSSIRSNWLQALKKAVPESESPATPVTPRPLLFSSDEEYRTASEGGRRGSEDWGELPPPSPPLTRTSLARAKTTRARPKPPRCQSRQSTLDSTSTDELDCIKLSESIELNNEINKQNVEISDLHKQLAKSVEETRSLEEEIARLKKFQAEAVIQEKKAKDMMLAFERTERELNQRNSQAELKFAKEQRSLQRRLVETEELATSYEEKCASLTRELHNKQRTVANLQEELASTGDRLARSREENDRLFKRVQELEGRTGAKRTIRCDSLTDLTNIDLDVDIDELGANELKEYCLDLRGRFEKAVLEIRAVKRELREAHEKCDNLELTNYSVQNNLEMARQESQAEISLLVSRLEHLTQKLNAAEKQIRSKTKSESRDKRRSLSLKGRESFSINKEVEDKVTELEAKILALERSRRRKYKRDRSSERSSPIDDKSLRRLRRKSLDSATSSEPMKLLMRLSTLENQVTSVNASNESLNIAAADNPAKAKIDECLSQVAVLKATFKRSPAVAAIEQNLNDLNEIVDGLAGKVTSAAEMGVINASASAVVKQLHNLLLEKLRSLSERKRVLRENDQLDGRARLELLAEKIAYENILIARIQEALTTPATGEVTCDRLIQKEVKETAHLMGALQKKLTGGAPKQLPACKTSADYLSKILAKCLTSAANGSGCRNFVRVQGPALERLQKEQRKLEGLLATYKATKLPQLAELLAAETLSIDKNCRLKKLSDDVINDFGRAAKDAVNSELVESEINHVLLRAAQIYQGHIDVDHAYFFTFFASERAALELWSDSVGDCLYEEMNKSVRELTEVYLNQLNKLQRQNWRRRVESERGGRASAGLLQEFADIVAHKALIDARMAVLGGKCAAAGTQPASLGDALQSDAHWDCLERSVQISQSVEAEFSCMLDRCSRDCWALVGQPELEQVVGYLEDLADEIGELQRQANVPADRVEAAVRTWGDVCARCRSLRDKLEEVRRAGAAKGGRRNDHRPVYLGTEYLTQVESLRAAYRCALASCRERHREADIEQLQALCERVLAAMEQWHRRTVQEMREAHALELERLRQEKEQALAEETQATLAALDAMRKAHEAEVQREVAKFKQDYARRQREDILDLSERLSVKCLEAAALEEQLGSATRQLTHAQQHILQLERNPQLSPMQN